MEADTSERPATGVGDASGRRGYIFFRKFNCKEWKGQ